MTKKLNKKGTSLVELIAVIVIMGIIAAIAIPTTIGVINRQKEKAAVESANGVIAAAKTVLLEAYAGTTVECVGKVTIDTKEAWFTTNGLLKASGDLGTVKVETGKEIYVLYDGTNFTVCIGDPATAATDSAAATAAQGVTWYDGTGETVPTVKVDGVSVKFNFTDCKFQ